MAVLAFGDWDMKNGAMPDYSMDFSKIREMHKQNKEELSRASLSGNDDLLAHHGGPEVAAAEQEEKRAAAAAYDYEADPAGPTIGPTSSSRRTSTPAQTSSPLPPQVLPEIHREHPSLATIRWLVVP
ncbi:hypothetical protein ZWY2020_040003 [Hordeum vulgare]|nr:hypothetical protein ZWY2020_040003 [Hordeum vulgare]